MINYAHILENKITATGLTKILNPEYINVVIDDSINNNIKNFGNNYYLYEDGEIILNPSYETEQTQKERERINMI